MFGISEPPLSVENEIVCEVWRFCGGWKPEVFPIAMIVYDIKDPLAVIDGLQAIRETMARRAEAEKAARG